MLKNDELNWTIKLLNQKLIQREAKSCILDFLALTTKHNTK